jgi:hypothetical protein
MNDKIMLQLIIDLVVSTVQCHGDRSLESLVAGHNWFLNQFVEIYLCLLLISFSKAGKKTSHDLRSAVHDRRLSVNSMHRLYNTCSFCKKRKGSYTVQSMVQSKHVHLGKPLAGNYGLSLKCLDL